MPSETRRALNFGIAALIVIIVAAGSYMQGLASCAHSSSTPSHRQSVRALPHALEQSGSLDGFVPDGTHSPSRRAGATRRNTRVHTPEPAAEEEPVVQATAVPKKEKGKPKKEVPEDDESAAPEVSVFEGGREQKGDQDHSERHDEGGSQHSDKKASRLKEYQGHMELLKHLHTTADELADGDDAEALRKQHREVPKVDAGLVAQIEKIPYVSAVWTAVQRGRRTPHAAEVVPVFVIPVFLDDEELRNLLLSVRVPVRLFAFSWNGNDPEMAKMMENLEMLPFGVVVNRFPTNEGFSRAVNAGMISGIKMVRHPPPTWFFLCNADTHFPGQSLVTFARSVNGAYNRVGLFYGPRVDHFAFAVSHRVVETIGFFDEVFFPGYMEDIDFRWRAHLAGLGQQITSAPFQHKHSSTLKKSRNPLLPEYRKQLTRGSQGWEYGWMKWGKYHSGQINLDHPPSGWRNPFNIPEAPLWFWVIDPAHRHCVRFGDGLYHKASSTCWYNGTVMLEHLPSGVTLTENLIRPGPSGR